MGKYVLGVNNVWATKRFVKPEEWTEISESIGIESVQFCLDLLDPWTELEASDEIIYGTLDSCEKHGIKIQSCFTGLAAYSNNLLLHPNSRMRSLALHWYTRALHTAKKLKVESVGGHFGAMSMSDYENSARRKNLISDLIRSIVNLSDEARKLRLKTLLWEPMPSSREPPSTVREAKNLLSQVNKSSKVPVELCVDVGHSCNPRAKSRRDLDPIHWLEQLGKDTQCVHIQQTDGKGDRHWPFTPRFNKIGVIKPEQVISALDASGTKGAYIFLEYIPPFEQRESEIIKDLSQSMKYWKEFL